MALDPENGAYLDSLGWAQFRVGRLEEAERNVRRALAQQPRNAVILDHLGDISHSRGRVEEAVDPLATGPRGGGRGGGARSGKVERKIGQARSAQGGGGTNH